MSTGRGFHLVPSPNWYLPHISDCNIDGLLAYGARNELVLLRANEEPPVFELIQNVHRDRVTSVAFSKITSSTIATASDDCFVRVWNVLTTEEGTISLTQEKELKFEKKIETISWKHGQSTLFLTEGLTNIWMWDVAQNNPAKLLKHEIRHQPFVLSPCPYKAERLAVGFKGGIVAILDTSKHGAPIFKLKGHEDDVISLSWSSKPSDEERDSLDIASTSRDKTLRIWNVEKERYIHMFKIPQSPNQSKTATDASNKNRLWVTCTWLPNSDSSILCSTITGEVIRVEFSPQKKPFTTTLDTKTLGGHNRCIFNMSYVGNILCSVSLDRQVVLYDLKTLKSTCSIATLGGFAQSMAFSPIDVGRLAIGCGDKTIRIWRTSCSTSPYSASMIWQGINGKVMVVTWHPEKENQLAFGTDEGHVGVLDPTASKPPNISRTFHRHIVYTLCWGPCTKITTEKRWFLYSCGDGKVFIHNPGQFEKEAKNLNDFLNPNASCKMSEIVWKPDYKALAIGFEDGTIEIYSEEFQKLAVLKAQKHLIQCLRWHPLCTTLNPSSQLQHWLASSSYDSVIHVYDLTDVITSGNKLPMTITQSSMQLVGHTSRVNTLSWNSHIDGRLASASYDSSVQIWDTLTGEPIGNYRGHRSLVFCVQWSATDPQVLFSGGDDFTVQQYSISTLQHSLPPPKKIKKSKKASVTEASVIAEPTLEDDMDISESNHVSHLCNGKIKEPECKAEASASMSSKRKKKKQPANQKSGFPLCNSLDCRGKDGMLMDIRALCREIERTTNPEKTRSVSSEKWPDLKNYPNLGFFLRASDFRKTQQAEEAGHRESGNSDLLFQISLWRGDIEGVLKEAAMQGQLNDYLVSLAPLGSRALWLDVCHKYALQLEKEENYPKAANYFLACHKIYEAINMLVSQHCYREALAVAKGRFPSTDPIFETIFHAWASKAEKDGNYELVAKCYLALSDFHHAAKFLTKRNDAASHCVAAFITAISGVAINTEHCIISCMHQALTRNEWQIARDMLQEQTKLKVVSDLNPLFLLVTVHELLTSALIVAKEQSSLTPLQEILECKNENPVIWKGTVLDEGKTFLELISEKVSADEKSKLLKSSLEILERLKGQRSLSSKEIVYETAIGLTQSLLTEDERQAWLQLSLVLETNYAAEPEYTILNILCRLLFPFELILPLKITSKTNVLKFVGKIGAGLEDLVKEAFTKSCTKSRPCDVNSSLLGFFSVNLLECFAQEASTLKKGSYLKNQESCQDSEDVANNLASVLGPLAILLKQKDFCKYKSLSGMLGKMDENLAKLSVAVKGGDTSAKGKLHLLQRERQELALELELLPEEARKLPYPKSALVTTKGKEVTKHVIRAIDCSKVRAKMAILTEIF